MRGSLDRHFANNDSSLFSVVLLTSAVLDDAISGKGYFPCAEARVLLSIPSIAWTLNASSLTTNSAASLKTLLMYIHLIYEPF